MFKLAAIKMLIGLSIARSKPMPRFIRQVLFRFYQLEGKLVALWTGQTLYSRKTAGSIWIVTYVTFMSMLAIAKGLYDLFLSRI